MSNRTLAVVIVAGGSGQRMGSEIPKQFLKVNGIEIIQHTLRAFLECKLAQKIVVVCNKDYIDHTQKLVTSISSDVPIEIVSGGATRQNSVYEGLQKVSDFKYVMIHDAVRCCLSVEDIYKLFDTLKASSACALGVRVNDTIKLADSESQAIIKTIDRQNLWHIQTPQAFDVADIIDAHTQALHSGFEATDDCALAERVGMVVKIVEGSYTNIKVTTPSDLILAGEFLKGRRF
ncbi:MAG: 2-C-methyl-D-erythritol 4-phosphate cytidylyltransferase [Clostridia bacterium]|nr:2-C-methyl-D-erythritol 4-phosphate cytidylyltransferase [Clostridia bacterium]